MTKTFGLCTTRRNDPTYTKLTFAEFIFDERYPREKMQNIILHEGIHMIDRNKHDHGKEWQAIADRVYMFYPYVGKIQRYVAIEDVVYRNEIKPKRVYKVKCLECGKIVTRKGYRAPKWYSQTERYRCNCGGRLKKII